MSEQPDRKDSFLARFARGERLADILDTNEQTDDTKEDDR